MQDERLCSIYLVENWVHFESNVTIPFAFTFCLPPAVTEFDFPKALGLPDFIVQFCHCNTDRVWVNQDCFETIFSCGFVNSLCYDFEKQRAF